MRRLCRKRTKFYRHSGRHTIHCYRGVYWYCVPGNTRRYWHWVMIWTSPCNMVVVIPRPWYVSNIKITSMRGPYGMISHHHHHLVPVVAVIPKFNIRIRTNGKTYSTKLDFKNRIKYNRRYIPIRSVWVRRHDNNSTLVPCWFHWTYKNITTITTIVIKRGLIVSIRRHRNHRRPVPAIATTLKKPFGWMSWNIPTRRILVVPAKRMTMTHIVMIQMWIHPCGCPKIYSN